MSDVFSEDTTLKLVEGRQTPSTKLEDLVGEGKKFATIEDLAKGKAESDAFIAQLQEELKGLRESITKEDNAAENLRKLQEEIAALKTAKTAAPKENTTPALTTEKLEELVTSVITKQEQNRTSAENLKAVNDTLTRQFGGFEKAQEVFRQKAEAIGMTIAELKAVAAKSPAAFYNILGINQSKEQTKGAELQTSKVNTTGLPVNSGIKENSKAYFKQLRKEMGDTAFYADLKLQQRMFQAKKSGAYDA